MIDIEKDKILLSGPKGTIPVKEDDEITLKMAMLIEGQCEGLGPTKAAQKFGYTRQRYHQILRRFLDQGAQGLISMRRGPKGNYRRTREVERQIIRHRFLDRDASPGVIAQKLNQMGYKISIRSVEKTISDWGLQKKTPPLLSGRSPDEDRDP